MYSKIKWSDHDELKIKWFDNVNISFIVLAIIFIICMSSCTERLNHDYYETVKVCASHDLIVKNVGNSGISCTKN